MGLSLFRLLLLVLVSLTCGCTEDESKPSPRVNDRLPAPDELPVEPADPQLDEALSSLRKGEFEAARRRLLAILGRRPADARAAFYLALADHKEKRYEAARRGFERLLSRGATFADFYKAQYYYGWCLHHLGRAAEARKAFETHLRGSPTTADAHFGIALTYLEDGASDLAETSLREAIRLAEKPTLEAKCRTRLADVLLAGGKLDAARTELERATRVWPRQGNAYYKLYRVLLRLGRAEEAEVALGRFHASRRD